MLRPFARMSTPSSTPFTAEQREQLILDHLPQVRLIATRIYNQTQRQAELDDLISAGILGLIAAIDRFDPAKGVQLKTYAEYKIRGEILDNLRHIDVMSRRARIQRKRIEEATATLQQRLGRIPETDEIAHEVGISVSEHHASTLAFRNALVLPLDLLPSSPDPEYTEYSGYKKPSISDVKSISPDQHTEAIQLANALRTALNHLDPEDERLLTLHFGDGVSILALATVFGIPEWTLRQKRDQALRRLRTSLAAFRSFTLSHPLNFSVL